jgi:hypothetical protein
MEGVFRTSVDEGEMGVAQQLPVNYAAEGSSISAPGPPAKKARKLPVFEPFAPHPEKNASKNKIPEKYLRMFFISDHVPSVNSDIFTCERFIVAEYVKVVINGQTKYLSLFVSEVSMRKVVWDKLQAHLNAVRNDDVIPKGARNLWQKIVNAYPEAAGAPKVSILHQFAGKTDEGQKRVVVAPDDDDDEEYIETRRAGEIVEGRSVAGASVPALVEPVGVCPVQMTLTCAFHNGIRLRDFAMQHLGKTFFDFHDVHKDIQNLYLHCHTQLLQLESLLQSDERTKGLMKDRKYRKGCYKWKYVAVEEFTYFVPCLVAFVLDRDLITNALLLRRVYAMVHDLQPLKHEFNRLYALGLQHGVHVTHLQLSILDYFERVVAYEEGRSDDAFNQREEENNWFIECAKKMEGVKEPMHESWSRNMDVMCRLSTKLLRNDLDMDRRRYYRLLDARTCYRNLGTFIALCTEQGSK